MKTMRCALVLAGAAAIGLAIWRPVIDRSPHQSEEAPLGGARPGDEYEVIALRITAKETLAYEVADGRRPLVEAATLFGELNRVPPVCVTFASMDHHTPLPTPPRTDEERLCQQVLLYVWSRHGSVGNADPGVVRLVAEFEALREAGGVRLPDPATLEPVAALLERARVRPVAAVVPPPVRPELILQTGPQESVTAVAVSPDGSLVATNSFDGRIRIHDARTGALLRALGSDVDRGGRGVVFTPDGRGIVVAGFHMDKSVRVWDVQTGKFVQTYAGHTEWEAYAVAVSPDGRLLASAGTDKQILIWDLATGKLRHRIEGQTLPMSALAFSPDSTTLASGGGDKTIRLWDTTTGRQRRALTGHRDWVCALAYSPDGKTLASGGCDWAFHRGRDTTRFDNNPNAKSEWKLWDAATGDVKRSVIESGRLLALAFAPDGKSLACGAGNDVRLYDLGAEGAGGVVTTHDGGVTSIAFTLDGSALITGSHDRTARRVELATSKVTWRLAGYWEQVNSVAVARDGSLIATGSSDLRFAEGTLKAGARHIGPGAVRLWDARTGRLLRRLGDPTEQVLAVALSPDGKRVAAGGGSPDGKGVLRVWDATTGAAVWSVAHSGDVQAVAFAPDGASLAAAGADGKVLLRDPTTGAVIRTLAGHTGGAASLAFSTDGTALAVGAGEGVAHLWDARTGQLTRTFRPKALSAGETEGGHRAIAPVALSPDGATLAMGRGRSRPAAGDRTVVLWDARTGELKREIASPQTFCRFVTFSPDGATLATNGLGKAIHFYDARTGELLRKANGHGHPPPSAVFSADGRALVSGGDFRTTIVWDAATGKLRATLVTFAETRPGADDWLAYAPDGSHDGSAGVDGFLAWRVGSDLLRDAAAAGWHRPREGVFKAPAPSR